MASVLVLYYSRTGNTQKMAKIITEELKVKGQDATLKAIDDVNVDELEAADGVIIGSPTYYGTMAAQIKTLLDETVKIHGKLDGKVGGAFSSAANIAGGNETTILDIINALLIHGFIIQGDPKGSHYGPVSIGAPDDRVEKECKRFADRFSNLLGTIY
ncbi:MAG: NAD(P)H-dependent oxidoreductase [Candidatus Orphnella occulta]|nr:NAD(P)H-dependent oxidoreductase [Candidatus Orphnella occulta]MDP8296850.1 NAD(P)H-dependent oxidoreductase [Candidatus Orphnella occulta]